MPSGAPGAEHGEQDPFAMTAAAPRLRSPDSGRRVAPPPFAGAAALAAELAAGVAGEGGFDAGTRALYATDGSNYRQGPSRGVVPPRPPPGAAALPAPRPPRPPLPARV